MNKYEKWEKVLDDYYRTVTIEQFLKDSLRSGINIEPSKGIVPGQKLELGDILRNREI
jgi:hypothetical protein